MFCKNCGTKNETTDNFCKNCGTPLENIQNKKESEFEKVAKNVDYFFKSAYNSAST